MTEPEDGVISLAELAERPAWEYDADANGWRYTGGETSARPNQWIYLPSTRVLLHPPLQYEVDLERCGDFTEVAHWVFHVGGKMWAHENNVLADLVWSLRAIFGLDYYPHGREDRCMVDLDIFESCLGEPMRKWHDACPATRRR